MTRIRSAKSRALVRLDSTTVMPRCSATRGALTALSSSSVLPSRTPSRTETPSGRVSRSPMRPRYSTSIAVDALALDQRHRELAEVAGERLERPEDLAVLRGDGRDVDRGGDGAAGERGDDLLGGLEARAVGGLRGARAEVRGDDDLRVGEERALGDRLGLEDVERGAADLARVERGARGPPRR